MSDELQAEIERLKAENKRLAGEVASLSDDLKDVRHEARDRRHEVKAQAQQIETLVKERDDFKAKAEADPEGLRKQVADHQATIRGLKHDRAFAKVAAGLKVNDPTKLQDLLKLAGYQPDGDEPDEAKIAAAFRAALQARPYLLDATATTAAGAATTTPGGVGATTTTTTTGGPGPGADRGQSVATGASRPEGRPPGRF